MSRRFAIAVEGLVIGPPDQRTTQIGPLARPDLADNLARQVDESVAAGAVVLTGGSRLSHPDRPGRGARFEDASALMAGAPLFHGWGDSSLPRR